MSARGTVFLVDDDESMRRAMTRSLGASGYDVRAFASGDEFLAAFDAASSGCVLLDLRMPGISGLEVQSSLQQRGADLPVVFLTAHGDVKKSVNAMKNGACDFLEKPADEPTLLAAIDHAIAKDVERRRGKSELADLRRRHESLTPRERDVLGGILQGLRNKQAAFQLGIAERTVKLHRARVLEKMGAGSVAELVRMTERLGVRPKTA